MAYGDLWRRLRGLPDTIHPRVLYEVRSEICSPLKHIMELSFNTGDVPVDCRSAIITALYKKGSKTYVFITGLLVSHVLHASQWNH